MEHIVHVLEPLAEATEILSIEDLPTGSCVHRLIKNLLDDELAPSNGDIPVVTDLKQSDQTLWSHRKRHAT